MARPRGPGDGQGGSCCGPRVKLVPHFFAWAGGGARGPGGLLMRQGEGQSYPSRDRHTPLPQSPGVARSNCLCLCHPSPPHPPIPWHSCLLGSCCHSLPNMPQLTDGLQLPGAPAEGPRTLPWRQCMLPPPSSPPSLNIPCKQPQEKG